jgi:hypothetical protein
MRLRPVLVFLLVPGAVAAQPANLPPMKAEQLPPLTTPAPVPSVMAPGELRYGGTPNSMPFVLSPPGIGNSFAGPVNSSPYSTTPSANWPPDAALPDGRDSVRGGVGSIVPNLSQ